MTVTVAATTVCRGLKCRICPIAFHSPILHFSESNETPTLSSLFPTSFPREKVFFAIYLHQCFLDGFVQSELETEHQVFRFHQRVYPPVGYADLGMAVDVNILPSFMMSIFCSIISFTKKSWCAGIVPVGRKLPTFKIVEQSEGVMTLSVFLENL